MNDFLTRLAGRQLGQIKTIEPLLTPLFAPRETTAGADAMRLGIEEESAPDRRDAIDTPALAAVPRTKVISARSSDADHEAISVGQAPPANRGPDVSMTLPEQPSLTPALPARPVKISRGGETPAPLATLTLPRETTAVGEQDAERKSGAAPTSLPVSVKRTAEMISASAPLVPFTDTRSSQGARRAGDLTAPAPLISAENQLVRSSAPSATPVQVTIGRIEVTAVTAAPAPRRPATTRKPAMSLDDYLARRQRREP